MRVTLAMLLLFLSGFAGLVYEISWIRQATLVFGSTTFAARGRFASIHSGTTNRSLSSTRNSSRVIDPAAGASTAA